MIFFSKSEPVTVTYINRHGKPVSVDHMMSFSEFAFHVGDRVTFADKARPGNILVDALFLFLSEEVAPFRALDDVHEVLVRREDRVRRVDDTDLPVAVGRDEGLDIRHMARPVGQPPAAVDNVDFHAANSGESVNPAGRRSNSRDPANP